MHAGVGVAAAVFALSLGIFHSESRFDSLTVLIVSY